MKRLKNVFCDSVNDQCAEILYTWIKQYLKRHDLGWLEINLQERFVACYKNDCDNMYNDYFTFDYTKVNLFK